MTIKEFFKIALVCLAVFTSGCVEKKIETETPKETNAIQSPMPKVEKKAVEPSNIQPPKEYLSCGYCGCCGQTTPIKRCLYRSKGDDLQKIIDKDKEPIDCSTVGCAGGIEYRYCD